MNYRLKQKNVKVISWGNEYSQAEAIGHLKEIGCTNVKSNSSGAGISIDFEYATPNSHKPIYYGSLFHGSKLVFTEDGTYPKIYSTKDFEDLFEKV